MNISREETFEAMRALLDPGDDVMVHASLAPLGHFEAGVESVIDAMLAAIGPRGTLLMMTDTRSFVQTGRFSLDQPSETGLLTERFRQRDGVLRSCVPMVSFCALGPNAGDYTLRYNSHLEEDAPLTRLLRNDGRILLLGVPYKKCTLYHLTEERHQSPSNIYKTFSGVLVEDGREVGPISQRYFVRRDINTRKSPAIVGQMLEDRGLVRTAALGAGELRSFRARDFDACSMQAIAADPNVFLVDVPN